MKGTGDETRCYRQWIFSKPTQTGSHEKNCIDCLFYIMLQPKKVNDVYTERSNLPTSPDWHTNIVRGETKLVGCRAYSTEDKQTD